MARLKWDQVGERFYETGVDQVVLFPTKEDGTYGEGVAWNGVTQIDESPSGADATPIYANNHEYLNLLSAEKFGGTIAAYTYPDEFEECDGSKEIARGIKATQQTRKPFGMAYRTLKGNDTKSNDYGYILHLVYGAKVSPSSKSRSTINENTEALSMSWPFNCTATEVDGMKPTAHIMIDSTDVSASALKAIEDYIYGSDGTGSASNAQLPLPAKLAELAGTTGA